MPSFRAVMIIISVFVAVLTGNPKSPISERLAITGALSAYYQVITATGVSHFSPYASGVTVMLHSACLPKL